MVAGLIGAGADLNIQSNTGNTALHRAAWNGHSEIVSTLIDEGADLNIQNLYGNTPIHRAAFKGHIGIVLKLLKANADLNIKENSDWNALYRDAEVVSTLIQAGADPYLQNKNGICIIQCADHQKIARYAYVQVDVQELV